MTTPIELAKEVLDCDEKGRPFNGLSFVAACTLAQAVIDLTNRVGELEAEREDLTLRLGFRSGDLAFVTTELDRLREALDNSPCDDDCCIETRNAYRGQTQQEGR